jgi:hypothetical protein
LKKTKEGETIGENTTKKLVITNNVGIFIIE